MPVESVARTSLTTNCPLYPVALMSLTWNGVSTDNPESPSDNVTVISSVAVTPSPALILLIPAEPLVGPTMRNSSILG